MNYFSLDNTEDYVLFSLKAEISLTVGAYTSQNEFMEFVNICFKSEINLPVTILHNFA